MPSPPQLERDRTQHHAAKPPEDVNQLLLIILWIS